MYKIFTAKHIFSNDKCYLKNSLAHLRCWICAASFLMCLTNGLEKVYFFEWTKTGMSPKQNLASKERNRERERERERVDHLSKILKEFRYLYLLW